MSVRALHHYDIIGLLRPSLRSEAGHRLYTARDITRLQGIRSLQKLGFSLGDIRGLLDSPDFSPQRIVELHLARLKDELEVMGRLYRLLEGLAARLRAQEDVSAQTFLHTIEVMTMVEKYYSKQQLSELEERRRLLGEERIRQVEAEWPELIAQVRAAMEKSSDPASDEVQRLARRWNDLVREFTGGDPEIHRALNTMYKEEPAMARQNGLDPELFAYLAKAQAAAKEG